SADNFNALNARRGNALECLRQGIDLCRWPLSVYQDVSGRTRKPPHLITLLEREARKQLDHIVCRVRPIPLEVQCLINDYCLVARSICQKLRGLKHETGQYQSVQCDPFECSSHR